FFSTRHRSPDRNFVLYISYDVLHHRYLCGSSSAFQITDRFWSLRNVFPAARRGADHACAAVFATMRGAKMDHRITAGMGGLSTSARPVSEARDQRRDPGPGGG